MLLLFAHGAGLGSSAPWMQTWSRYLSQFGRVVTFDYPYMERGSKRPDRMPKLLDAHRAALDTHRRPGEPVMLVGKSMGSRVGCHLATTEAVDGIICLGFPLCGGGKREKLRDAVLVEQRQRMLFIQGTRDKLCPLDLLETVRGRMTAENALHIVDTGDHSLQITKTHTKQTGITQEESDARAVDAIRAFLAER